MSRFPQLKPPFQLGVPVDNLRDFSQEKATAAAAEQGPGLVTAHGSFKTFCPSRGVSRDHTSRECHRRGPAELGQQVLVSIRHWLQVQRELLPGCRTAGRCVLLPGLSSVLEVVSSTRSSRSGESNWHELHRRHHFDLIEQTQLSHTVFKQHLTSVFLLHMLQETSSSERLTGVGNRAALRTTKVFLGLPGLLCRPRLSLGICVCWRWRSWHSQVLDAPRHRVLAART